jgi:hypothetical protein
VAHQICHDTEKPNGPSISPDSQGLFHLNHDESSATQIRKIKTNPIAVLPTDNGIDVISYGWLICESAKEAEDTNPKRQRGRTLDHAHFGTSPSLALRVSFVVDSLQIGELASRASSGWFTARRFAGFRGF